MITVKIVNTNSPESFSIQVFSSHDSLKNYGYKNTEFIDQELRFYSHLWVQHDGSQNVTAFKFAHRMKDIANL